MYEIYRRAKAFQTLPHDVAVLDTRVDEVGRYLFDRGIWMFGESVERRVEAAGTSRYPSIAAMQRQREWERLMGVDMTESTTGFADPESATDDTGAGDSRVLASGF